jgi:hypothetical protein
MRALPGVAPSSIKSKPSTSSVRLVPDAADPIPAAVLSSPFIGEFRRFDGAAAPNGWMLAQGQTLDVTQNPHLFSVLGRIAGGDGKTTFRLPGPGYGAIIAVAGMLSTSPQVLAQSGRHMSPKDSLGPNAILRPVSIKVPSQPAMADLAAQRRIISSAIRVGRAFPVPVSAELAGRYRQAETDARSAALAQLGPESRMRLESAVNAAVAGRIVVYRVVAEMISSLTNAEADALLHVNDAMIQPFNDRASASRTSSPQNDAANFLVSVAFTPEQLRAIRRIERSRL